MKSIFIGLAVVLSFAGYQLITALNRLSPEINNAGFELPASSPFDTASLGGTWFLQPVLPSDTASGKIPTITFDVKQGSFNGNTGCNTIRGSFSLSGNRLELDQHMVSTKMSCPGYNESAFIQSLEHTNGYKMEQGVLILLFDATELSRWTRKPFRAPAVNKA